ncbi:hypothetical protein [Coleofasciculus sp. E2-BRE-01]
MYVLLLLRSQDLPSVSVGLEQQVQQFTVLMHSLFKDMLLF